MNVASSSCIVFALQMLASVSEQQIVQVAVAHVADSHINQIQSTCCIAGTTDPFKPPAAADTSSWFDQGPSTAQDASGFFDEGPSTATQDASGLFGPSPTMPPAQATEQTDGAASSAPAAQPAFRTC